MPPWRKWTIAELRQAYVEIGIEIARRKPPEAEQRPRVPDQALYQVRPVLRKRHCGGWLATTPQGWPLGIGVTADTEEEAVREFEATLKRWSEIEEISE